MKNLTFILIIIWITIPNISSAREPLTDHALISPYEGSIIKRKSTQEFDKYDAFTGMDKSGKKPTGLSLTGKITKILYTKPKERSILEVFRNYQNAVKQAGAEILYTCNQKKGECATRYAGPTLQKYSGIQSISNLAGRYSLSRIVHDKNTAYVAIAVGQNFTDIHIIEVKNMDTGMVSLDAEALGKKLDSQGFVIVEGIYFDTDKVTLKANSSPALKEISKLLIARPKLKVYVVGHTDMQGGFTHNLALSERRAKAVVVELALNYGVSRNQMEGHGVGPLAPQATNYNDSGRAKNRRVVLVVR
mgnify:CR=1 FL=1